jgi:Xaa-Pro dipeptidase
MAVDPVEAFKAHKSNDPIAGELGRTSFGSDQDPFKDRPRSRFARIEPPLEQAYYAKNLELIRLSLQEYGLGAVIIFDPENIFWLTGYRSIGYFTFQCIVVLGSGKPIMVSRRVNQANALSNELIDHFVPVDDTDDPVQVLASFLKGKTEQSIAIGVETGSTYLSVDTYLALMALIPNRLVTWTGVAEKARTIKSPEQLQFMRHAAEAAVSGLDAAIKAIAPGRSENDLAAAMLHGTTAAGSEYTRVPLVVTGQATGVCFTTWQRRTIRKGDVVFLEAAANINRYHAMVARSCTVGPASPDQKRIAAVTIEALNRTIDAIRPGVTSGAVDAVCRGVFEAAGVGKYFDHRTGYAIGIGFPPNWAEGRFLALKPNDSTVLVPGMTFHIVPTIFMEEFGFMTSESVAVTESGCEVLTRYPRQLFEVEV